MLDEPTAGLDPNAHSAILEMIEQIHEAENNIIILISHNMNDIAAMDFELLKDHLKQAGKDFDTLSRNEKRALVCAQCHVEYYFQDKSFGAAKKPVFPWEKGKNPEQIYEYYKTRGDTTIKRPPPTTPTTISPRAPLLYRKILSGRWEIFFALTPLRRSETLLSTDARA